MRVIQATFLSVLTVLALAMPVYAQDQGTMPIDQWITEIMRSTFLTVSCDVPQIQPLVTTLKRTSSATDADNLIKRFFESRDNLLGDERIISPVWGPGTRYKSGMVVRMVQNQEFGQRSIIGPAVDTELVPVFLDVYPHGFLYANNISHTAVYATNVKAKTEDTADISYYTVYNEKEGQQAAEAIISELLGDLRVPAGFQSHVKSEVQHTGERLFNYIVYPEYITKYETFDAEGNVTGAVPIGMPVYSCYVHVLLDGDKMLAGCEYFWDAGLTAAGEPKRSISAPQAIILARDALLKEYKDSPPLLTVTSIKPGFIQDGKDRTKLVPAWLFDAWYVMLNAKQKPNTELEGQEREEIALPFAINAETGEFMLLGEMFTA